MAEETARQSSDGFSSHEGAIKHQTGEASDRQDRKAAPPVFDLVSSETEFRSLDPRVISLWRVAGSITCAAVLLISLIGAIIFWLENPFYAPLIFLAWFWLLALCGWLVYWRPPRLYRAWGYRIDDRVLETRSGIMFQVRRLLPLTRLQHVDLQRGPIERAFGLASLILHTAGTHQASITIPGLDAEEAARLRDHLVTIGGDDAV